MMRFKRLDKWLLWLEQLHPVAIDLGLERVVQVAAQLPINTASSQVVTVAGTSGKGSGKTGGKKGDKDFGDDLSFTDIQEANCTANLRAVYDCITYSARGGNYVAKPLTRFIREK